MQSLMYLQFLAEEEPLVTDGTLERFVSTVYQTVLAQRALIDKRVSADVAGIRAFAGMQSDVPEQITAG